MTVVFKAGFCRVEHNGPRRFDVLNRGQFQNVYGTKTAAIRHAKLLDSLYPVGSPWGIDQEVILVTPFTPFTPSRHNSQTSVERVTRNFPNGVIRITGADHTFGRLDPSYAARITKLVQSVHIDPRRLPPFVVPYGVDKIRKYGVK